MAGLSALDLVDRMSGRRKHLVRVARRLSRAQRIALRGMVEGRVYPSGVATMTALRRSNFVAALNGLPIVAEVVEQRLAAMRSLTDYAR